ncbi:MAG: phosphoribosylformylglycinamidine synthase, partial [Candidatus Levyibacteriota bacterium]
MPTRIEVATTVYDTRAAVRQKKLQKNLDLSKKLTDLFLLDVYTIDKIFSHAEFEQIARAISNPVTQATFVKTSSVKISKPKKFAYAIEIGFLPGVTDNISHTTIETIEDMLKVKFSPREGVYTSQVTFVVGDLSKQDALKIADSLYNPLIQRMSIKSYDEVVHDNGMDTVVPKVALHQKVSVDEVNLTITDEELAKIGKEGIANPDGSRRGPLALDLTFMKTIQAYFKKLERNPTDIELESIAQTWSEHCKHTIFADPIDSIKQGLFNTYIKKATQDIRKKKGNKDFCVSVFTDNSGAIAFDKEYLITHKVETHNSP